MISSDTHQMETIKFLTSNYDWDDHNSDNFPKIKLNEIIECIKENNNCIIYYFHNHIKYPYIRQKIDQVLEKHDLLDKRNMIYFVIYQNVRWYDHYQFHEEMIKDTNIEPSIAKEIQDVYFECLKTYIHWSDLGQQFKRNLEKLISDSEIINYIVDGMSIVNRKKRNEFKQNTESFGFELEKLINDFDRERYDEFNNANAPYVVINNTSYENSIVKFHGLQRRWVRQGGFFGEYEFDITTGKISGIEYTYTKRNNKKTVGNHDNALSDVFDIECSSDH